MKEVILVDFMHNFSGIAKHIKIQNQQSTKPLGHKKGLKIHENKIKRCCLPVMNKRTRKRKRICERNGFCT